MTQSLVGPELSWVFLPSTLPPPIEDVFPQFEILPLLPAEPWLGPVFEAELDDDTSEQERAEAMVLSFARAALEAFTGHRPLGQLSRWLSPQSMGQLQALSRHEDWRSAQLAMVHASLPTPAAIEGVIGYRRSIRLVAAAIRIQLEGSAWRCQSFDLLLPGTHVLTNV
jgi:hypothetical protein